MRAAVRFAHEVGARGADNRISKIRVELFGSLGATGHGHGSVKAVLLGLSGEEPETVDPVAAGPAVEAIRATKRLTLPGGHEIDMDPDADIILHRRKRLPFHPNAMRFAALDSGGAEVATATYYSIGGGFVLGEDEAGQPAIVRDPTPVPYPFSSGAELLAHTTATGLPISGVMLANETVRRTEAEVRAGLLAIW